MKKKPSLKEHLKPILIGIFLGLFVAVACAWCAATSFENYSFAARLQFEPHLLSEAEILRRKAALLICAQSLVNNGFDFACRGAAFSYFAAFIGRQTSKKLSLVDGDLVYFFLGPRPYPLGFMASSFFEIVLMAILGLFLISVVLAIMMQALHGFGGLFHI